MKPDIANINSLSTIDFPGKSCMSCKVRRLCLPHDMDDAACAAINRLVRQRHVLLRGEHPYQANDPVEQRLYAIQSGQFKVYQLSAEGEQTVTGFRFGGDFLGLESIGLQLRRNSVVALSDAVLCEFSHAQLAGAALRDAALAPYLSRLLLTELATELSAGLQLSDGNAEQKVAAFLLLLTAANVRRGENGDLLELSMTRADIADYLGLAAATVSRTLSRFQELGYLSLRSRQVAVTNRAGLRACAPMPSAMPAQGRSAWPG